MKKLASSWQRREVWTLMGLLCFGLAYVCLSVALDSGRYWYYTATLIAGWAGIWFIARAIKNDRR